MIYKIFKHNFDNKAISTQSLDFRISLQVLLHIESLTADMAKKFKEYQYQLAVAAYSSIMKRIGKTCPASRGTVL
jgi:hypothetical protein